MIYVPVLTNGKKRKYGLLSAACAEQIIRQADAVVSESAPVGRIPTPKGKQKTVQSMWEAHIGTFFDDNALGLLFQLIDKLAPEYSESAREYFSGGRHRGYNCYVLKAELFYRLCKFQFPIMFEAEKRLDLSGYTQTMQRTPAFMGEMLYGIFIYHIITKERWRVRELQLVFFRDSEQVKNWFDLLRRTVWNCVDVAARKIIDPIMPKGSRRRELLKNMYYTLTPAERRGAAEIKNGEN